MKPFSKMTQEEKEYIFDLQGYLVIDNALRAEQLGWINRWIDSQPRDLPTGTWLDHVEIHTYGKTDGINYQNIIEGGKVFEDLIDNPVWIDLVRKLIENDYNRITINECFLNLRGEGGFIGIHSGGTLAAFTSSFRNHAGSWMVGQINILMALQDIGEGDGATVVVPGSHKSHELHPVLRPGDPSRVNSVYRTDKPDETLGAIQVRLKAGEALMFTDALLHGGCSRTNAGERRILIYRYSPHSMQPRYNYVPSAELLARLTPAQKAIIQSVPVRYSPKAAPSAR